MILSKISRNDFKYSLSSFPRSVEELNKKFDAFWRILIIESSSTKIVFKTSDDSIKYLWSTYIILLSLISEIILSDDSELFW